MAGNGAGTVYRDGCDPAMTTSVVVARESGRSSIPEAAVIEPMGWRTGLHDWAPS
jgi:hypothetical protein